MINKKTLDALIKSGALDTLGERGQLLANMERMSSYLHEIEHKQTTKQIGIFDQEEQSQKLTLISVPAMTFEEKIREERGALGISISGDPLDGLERYIEKKSI